MNLFCFKSNGILKGELWIVDFEWEMQVVEGGESNIVWPRSVITRDGRISDPAIRIRPDFHYPVKSGSGRIARGTPDRIFASYNTRHSLRMMSLRS